jgi:hypothetical protein
MIHPLESAAGFLDREVPAFPPSPPFSPFKSLCTQPGDRTARRRPGLKAKLCRHEPKPGGYTKGLCKRDSPDDSGEC